MEEEVWTAYSAALEIVQHSKFAVGRKPGGGVFNSMLSVANPRLHSKFERFCRSHSNSFTSNNPRYVRKTENGTESKRG